MLIHSVNVFYFFLTIVCTIVVIRTATEFAESKRLKKDLDSCHSAIAGRLLESFIFALRPTRQGWKTAFDNLVILFIVCMWTYYTEDTFVIKATIVNFIVAAGATIYMIKVAGIRLK